MKTQKPDKQSKAMGKSKKTATSDGKDAATELTAEDLKTVTGGALVDYRTGGGS